MVSSTTDREDLLAGAPDKLLADYLGDLTTEVTYLRNAVNKMPGPHLHASQFPVEVTVRVGAGEATVRTKTVRLSVTHSYGLVMRAAEEAVRRAFDLALSEMNIFEGGEKYRNDLETELKREVERAAKAEVSE